MSVETSGEPSGVPAQATVELPLLTPALARSVVMNPTISTAATTRVAGRHPAGHAEVGGSDAKPRSTDRLYALDLFRFFAAMAVFGYHLLADIGGRGAWGARPDKVFGEALYGAAHYGWMGVEFFFIISGFVICMSCWDRTLADFFTSRVSRLMPAYIFAVLVTGTVLKIAPVQSPPALSQVLVNLTMLQRFVNVREVDDVYWTLFVELKFYILFASVVWFGLTYRRVVMFNVIWTVLYLLAGFTKSGPFIAIVDPTFAPYFIAGTTLYLIYRFGPNLLLWGMLAVSVAMTVPSLERRVAQMVRTYPISYQVALVIIFILFGLMILLSLRKLSWLRFPGVMTLGALTYPLYLLHRQLSWVAVVHLRGAMPAWLLTTSIIVAVLALAFLTHRLVERPLARFLRHGLKASFAAVRAAEPVVAGVPATGRRNSAAKRLGHELTNPAEEPRPSTAPQRGSTPAFARSLEPRTSEAEETADA